MTPHELAHELEKIYGPDLKSVVLYGSAVDGTPSRKFTDTNIFCVLSQVTPAMLARSNKLIRKWTWRGNPPPHFFDTAHIERSLDVFPLDFLDMQDRHKVLVGLDPLEGIKVDSTNLRHQCESEFKGKLIHLRTLYAANCHRPRQIARLMVESFPTFLAGMRGILRLLKIAPPKDARAVAELVGQRVGINPTIFFDIIDIRQGESMLPRHSEALIAFERYLTELTALTKYVDEMKLD